MTGIVVVNGASQDLRSGHDEINTVGTQWIEPFNRQLQPMNLSGVFSAAQMTINNGIVPANGHLLFTGDGFNAEPPNVSRIDLGFALGLETTVWSWSVIDKFGRSRPEFPNASQCRMNRRTDEGARCVSMRRAAHPCRKSDL